MISCTDSLHSNLREKCWILRCSLIIAMWVWLFLFGAVACVALSGATPVGEVKETSKESLDHHEIHKRQLEVVNAASATICDAGIPILEDKVENVNIPSFSVSGTTVSSIDVKRVDIGECDVSFRGGITNPSVRISLSNIYIKITGRYRKKVFLFVFRGSWTLEVRNGRLDVDVTLKFDPSSRKITKITVNSCRDDFTNVKVHFHGSIWAFIINLFKGKISRSLSKQLENKVCEVGVPFLENQVLGLGSNGGRPLRPPPPPPPPPRPPPRPRPRPPFRTP